MNLAGAGSGIQRALGDGLNVQFDNNEATHEFIVTILRGSNHQKAKNGRVTVNGCDRSRWLAYTIFCTSAYSMQRITPYYHFHLIEVDEDDKFVDCAISEPFAKGGKQ